MSRRKPRGLNPDEEELWQKVAGTTQPLRQAKQTLLPEEKSKPKRAPTPPPVQQFRVGEKVRHDASHDLVPGLGERLTKAPVQMDSKAFGKMKRGKLKPEGRLDLHGMTLARAHPALVSFILRSQADGKRLVLVITGKGKSSRDDGPIPVRKGVLKHQVPQWLRSGSLAHAVLQVSQAHLKHGGEGAYYVYLRRNR